MASCSVAAPLRVDPEDSDKGNSPIGRLAGHKDGQRYRSPPIHVVSNDLVRLSRTWREQDRNIVSKAWGRGIWVSLLGWAQSVRIFTSHVNEHQSEATVSGDLNQMDKASHSVDTSQPLSLLPLSLLNGLLNKITVVAGMELMYGLHSMSLHRGQSGYSHR